MGKSGQITGREDSTNRDGDIVVRILQTEVSSADDLQSVELADHFGTESNPPTGSRVLIMKVGEAWKLTSSVKDSTDLELNGKIGAKQVYSTDEPGTERIATVTLDNDGAITLQNTGGSSIILQPDGNIEINGNTDTAVAFTDMKAAFDELRTEVNAFVSVFNSHTHPGDSGGTTGTPNSSATDAAADMSGAEVPTVKVP